MPAAHTDETTDIMRRPQLPWVTRNPSELPLTTFRTALRGFDRDEVRTVLEDVAADYRVLQMQNASLRRQLENLEAILASCRDIHPAADSRSKVQQQQEHTLQRANDEAQAILQRARAQAEEMIAGARARVRAFEQHFEELGQDQKRFRTVLGATVSDLMAVLTLTGPGDGEGGPHDGKPAGGQPADVRRPRLLTAGAPARPAPDGDASAPEVRRSAPPEQRARAAGARAEGAAASAPVRRGSGRAAATISPAAAAGEIRRIETVLKGIDAALVEIPALPGE